MFLVVKALKNTRTLSHLNATPQLSRKEGYQAGQAGQAGTATTTSLYRSAPHPATPGVAATLTGWLAAGGWC